MPVWKLRCQQKNSKVQCKGLVLKSFELQALLQRHLKLRVQYAL